MAKCEKIVLVKIHTYVFMVEKNGLRCLFGGVLDLMGRGLARPAIFAVPHGPARHEKWPIGQCLGRRLGPQANEAWPAGHGVPPWPDSHRAVPARDRAVPGQAGPMPRYSHTYKHACEHVCMTTRTYRYLVALRTFQQRRHHVPLLFIDLILIYRLTS